MKAYVVKTNNNVITKVFECADEACKYVESEGFIFLGEDEYKYEFSNNGKTAMVIKCNFIEKKVSLFQIGEKIKFKKSAIESECFGNFVKVGDICHVEAIEGNTAYLRLGAVPQQYQIVKVSNLTENWFERVEVK